ncbi:hypothetical protein A3I90_01040 [Candidatus Nomurabacteria bacterium RIFCSPLOWO2_02_FULL_41_9]|nr:MAG: hypothetical protein A3B01_01840 [Candidatus Nomurabacteria bacterium RIFCSPLOWO2_01_FULL_41_52b]OGJ00443.1 MAG: hypothetical protein A3I90_01040 [Candidatus Nomurabacteria bacterium RIFCSPLOWO2_02_FULL_41_9]
MENFTHRMHRLKLAGRLPDKSEIKKILASFSKKEWGGVAVLLFIFTLSAILMLESINKSFMIEVPLRGGKITEGIVGSPRFVNPVVAFSDTDQELLPLIYSGLMRRNSSGGLIPDLAEKYEISENGLIYTFTLKDDLYFHDGNPLTIEDIIFTIEKVKDPLLKSSKKAFFDGVTVEKIDDKTLKFTLRQPYASFLNNMTLGIIPGALWRGSPLELNDANTKPIGSGPYMITEIGKKSSGIIEYYKLESFGKFALGSPYIKNLTLRFYPNENEAISALRRGAVSQISSIAPSSAEVLKEEGYRVESSVLPRVFGLFFNQNQNQIFTQKAVIRAINESVNKNRIVREILNNYGVPINSPIPPKMLPEQKSSEEKIFAREDIVLKVKNDLAKDGWKKGKEGYLEKIITEKGKKTTIPLQFSISTGNAPELAKSAELIKENLEEIGMKVDIKTFEIGSLNQNVIRPRKYDVLLFGQIVGNESDLFAFWHSSQRKDPGLNVAMYTNVKVDKILEDAFATLDEKEKNKKYAEFEAEIKKDMPAVFLYSPSFIYIVAKNLRGLVMNQITSPTDRFLNIYSWYTEVDNVWKIFAPN